MLLQARTSPIPLYMAQPYDPNQGAVDDTPLSFIPHISTVDEIQGTVDIRNSLVTYDGQYTEVRKGKWTVDRVSRDVAIRIMNPNRRFQDEIPKVLDRVSRQYAVWSKLHHPNVARFLGISRHSLYDVAAFNVVPCLISEWYPGNNLEKYVANSMRGGSLCRTPEAIVRRLQLVISLGDGLQYLQNNGVVHGDLNPRNIIYNTATKQPVIIDFGFSRLISIPGFTTATKCGSARYSAPRGENISNGATHEEPVEYTNAAGSLRSDVWSFGMVALLILSFRKPYHEVNASENSLVDETIQKAKLAGCIPKRPNYKFLSDERWDALWQVLEGCWRAKGERLDMKTVLTKLNLSTRHN